MRFHPRSKEGFGFPLQRWGSVRSFPVHISAPAAGLCFPFSFGAAVSSCSIPGTGICRGTGGRTRHIKGKQKQEEAYQWMLFERETSRLLANLDGAERRRVAFRVALGGLQQQLE